MNGDGGKGLPLMDTKNKYVEKKWLLRTKAICNERS